MLDAFSKQETQIKGGCKLENSRRLSRCNTTATASVHQCHCQLDALADRSVSRCGCHAVSSWEDRCVCFLRLGRGGVDCGPRRQLRDYPNLKPNRTELRIQLFFPQRGRCAPIPTPKWWIGVHLGFCFLLSNAFDPGVKSSSVTQMQRKQWN